MKFSETSYFEVVVTRNRISNVYFGFKPAYTLLSIAMTVQKAFILIGFILIITSPSFGQKDDDTYFEHLTVADGLFSSNVSCITQDNNGLLWIGTSRGLNYYDGIQLGRWTKRSTDNRHIIGKNVNAMLFDEDKIYLGIGIGFFVYNFNTNQLDRYKPNSSSPKNSVTCIYKDSKNNIWVGLRDGLCRFVKNKNTHKFKHYKIPSNNKLSSIGSVKSINEDKNNTLWITTLDDLWIYQPKTDKLIKAPVKNDVPPLNCRAAITDLQGNLLIASGNTIFK
ncbi:MAG: hypothetical protein MI922_21885, partial [Bacteroidales bacterium]|nr:hypothetical protein [Bacteroidales bacterium]